MKRLLVLVAVTAAVAGLASIAMAGDYHVGQLLVCSDCHVMHGSQAHAYPETGRLDPPGSKSVAFGPYSRLLREESVNTTCLLCHDGRTDVPDVLGATSASPTNGRSAGALNTMPGHGFTNSDGYVVGDGHTLWSTDTPPGNDGSYASFASEDGLECSDCHQVHGSANYRNMALSTRSTTSVWYNKKVTYSIGTFDATKDVYELAARGYGVDNVNYVERAQNVSAYADWCKTCHTKFHGSPGDFNTIGGPSGVGADTTAKFIRHPSAGVDVGQSILDQIKKHAVGHRVKLMQNTSPWDYTNTTATPSCFTCHKSHGNKNGFGLIWFVDVSTTGPNSPATVGPITEEGDNYGGAAYRDLCKQCHPMGSFPSGNPTNIIP
jgi:cytochrome c553